MNKWLLLAGGALALAWGPFLYAELTSEPAPEKAPNLPQIAAGDQAPPVIEPVEPSQEPDEMPEEEPAEEEPAEDEAPDEPPGVAEPSDETRPETKAKIDPAAGLPEATAAEVESQAEPEPEAPVPSGPAAEPDEEGVESEAPAAQPPPPSGPTEVLKEAFESEPRDALWATEAERRIADVFTENEAPEEMFQGASCQRTVCRIELQWSQEQSESYRGVYQNVTKEFGSTIAVEPGSEPDDQGAHPLFVYVLRSGYSLDDLKE